MLYINGGAKNNKRLSIISVIKMEKWSWMMSGLPIHLVVTIWFSRYLSFHAYPKRAHNVWYEIMNDILTNNMHNTILFVSGNNT